MNWLNVFHSTAQRYGLQEDMEQEILAASMEAARMGLEGREARNYVARCLHRLFRDYGIRKVNNKYEKIEVPMSLLYFGGEGNEYLKPD
jgi:hypothetical protein